MVQAREHAQPKARRSSKAPVADEPAANELVVVTRSDDGQIMIIVRPGYVPDVKVSKVRSRQIPLGRDIPLNRDMYRRLIVSYVGLAGKAKQTGKSHYANLVVQPDGQVEVLSEKVAADPLAAAMARAKARATVKVAEVLESPEMLTARELGPLIGASHETVNVKRKRRELLGLEGSTRGVRYPRWQITEDGLPLPGLQRIFMVLGDQPWAVYRFLRTHHAELDGHTALDAMKAGHLDAVVAVADNQVSGAFA